MVGGRSQRPPIPPSHGFWIATGQCEERFNPARLGKGYVDYMERTKMLIPSCREAGDADLQPIPYGNRRARGISADPAAGHPHLPVGFPPRDIQARSSLTRAGPPFNARADRLAPLFLPNLEASGGIPWKARRIRR